MTSLLCVCLFSVQPACAQDAPPTKPLQDTEPKQQAAPGSVTPTPREALARFNELIGEWRGIGQPKRGSNRGAWSEKARWQWDFTQPAPQITMQSPASKLLRSLRLSFDTRSQRYQLAAEFAGESKPVHFVAADPKKLVFTEINPRPDAARRRVTLQILGENRVTLLVERGTSRLQRVAGIGYTRKGTSLAGRGNGQPECIVTGGAGTIRVSYKGKTYFVCCTGCQQAFEDDPEAILADYYTRMAARKKPASGKPGNPGSSR